MKRTLLTLAATLVALMLAGCTVSAQSAVPPTPSAMGSPASPVSTLGGAATTTAMPMGTTGAPQAPAKVTGVALAGQKIFDEGLTPSGPVKFTGGSDDVGNGACANCHGVNAGGGDGPMITWSMLTAKGSTMPNMPKYSYQTPDQVMAAFTTGVRPDGSKLKNDMPRYSCSAEEAAAVIEYLKAVDH